MTTPPDSVELRELVLPGIANHHGTLFAGQGMLLMAKVAFLAARQRVQHEVVMASVSGIDFLAPVPVGHQLVLRGEVGRIGRSSVTVTVTGRADRPGQPQRDVLKGVFKMVAVDAAGRPVAIDPSVSNQETLA